MRFEPSLILLGVWLVANPEVFCGGLRALVVAEEDDLSVGMHERPAFQGISLDDVAVSYEWLGSREKRDIAFSCLIRSANLNRCLGEKRSSLLQKFNQESRAISRENQVTRPFCSEFGCVLTLLQSSEGCQFR